MICNDDNDELAGQVWTSICCSSVMNLGDNPCVAGESNTDRTAKMPKKRKARHYKPLHNRVLSLLLKCVPLHQQTKLCSHFDEQMKSPKTEYNECLVAIPIQWITGALKELSYYVSRICSIDDVYPKHGIQDYTSNFLLDIVHNRKKHVKGDGVAPLAEQDPDKVAMATTCDDSDMEDYMDYKYHTVLGLLPGAGVFYDCCDRRRTECGVGKSMVQLSMSWFRLSLLQGPVQQLGFGADGYVKRFGSVGLLPDGSAFVSGWRVVSRSCTVKKLS
jgi:hypothetical protein